MPKQTHKLRDLPPKLEPLVLYTNGSTEVQMFPKAGQIKRKYKVNNQIVYKRSEVNLLWCTNR